MITSKGAAGVTGSGFIVLASTLSALAGGAGGGRGTGARRGPVHERGAVDHEPHRQRGGDGGDRAERGRVHERGTRRGQIGFERVRRDRGGRSSGPDRIEDPGSASRTRPPAPAEHSLILAHPAHRPRRPGHRGSPSTPRAATRWRRGSTAAWSSRSAPRRPRAVTAPGQLPAFRYLTGFLEPNAALVLVLRGGGAGGTLYTLARDPRRALYDGSLPDSTAIARTTGLAARSIAALGPALDSLAGTGLPFYTLRDFSSADDAETDSLTRGASFLRAFADGRMRGLELRDATRSSTACARGRARPSWPCSGGRSTITVAGHARGHARRPPRRVGVRDRGAARVRVPPDRRRRPRLRLDRRLGPQLHPVPLRRQRRAGCRRATWSSSTSGPASRGYAADVTRTLPVSGKFTPEQRAIYQIVRDAQAAAERVARPGALVPGLDATPRAPWSPAAWPGWGSREGVDATFDPPWADQCPRRAGALHPGVPLHGPRPRPRHRARGP